MEEAALTSDLAPCLGCDPTTSDLDAAASALSAGVDAAFAALRAALARCVAVTGGTELRALARSLDSAAQQHLTRLQAAAGVLHARFSAAAAAAAPGAASAGAAVAAPADLAAMLSLLLVARKAGAALAGLEAALRAAVATAVPRLEAAAAAAAAGAGAGGKGAAAAGGGGGVEAGLPLRLAAFPGKLPPLARLRDQIASDPRFVALKASDAAADALFQVLGAGAATGCGRQGRRGAGTARARRAHRPPPTNHPSLPRPAPPLPQSVSDHVYSALLSPIERALEALPSLPAWPAAGVGAGGPGAPGLVPQFSAYPLPLVTGVGEYLMSLPGHLELLMAEDEAAAAAAAGGDAAAGGEELAAEWLDKVQALGAGAAPKARGPRLHLRPAPGLCRAPEVRGLAGARQHVGAGTPLPPCSRPPSPAKAFPAPTACTRPPPPPSQVVRGAGLMYADAILHIPSLGAGGAAQLAADAEYFCNVMSALAVAPPPALITVQVRRARAVPGAVGTTGGRCLEERARARACARHRSLAPCPGQAPRYALCAEPGRCALSSARRCQPAPLPTRQSGNPPPRAALAGVCGAAG
jgi:hypothetical protein